MNLMKLEYVPSGMNKYYYTLLHVQFETNIVLVKPYYMIRQVF